MTNNSKENKIKKEIAFYVILVGVLILFSAKLLGIVQLSSMDSQLVSSDDDVREDAIEKFKKLDYKDKEKHVDFLIKALNGQDDTSRYLAAFTLGKIGPVARKAIPALVEALKSENYDVRWNAIHALAHLGFEVKKTASALYPFLKAENKYERASAAIALVAMGETNEHIDEIVPQLTAALQYNDTWTRKRAMTMLGNLGPAAKAATATLLKLAQSSDDKIRRHAVWALGRMGDRSQVVIDTLVKSLQDEDHNVRLNALISLDSLYPEAKSTIPVVKAEFNRQSSRRYFDGALLFSAYEGDPEDAQALINLGADVNVKGYYTGKTALMVAAQEGHFETIKVLLKNGAKVNVVSDGSGVDPNVTEPFLPMNMFSMFQLIFSSGNQSNIGTGKYEGKTALMYAVESEISDDEKIEIIKSLVDRGADKNILSKDRRTALMIARELKLTNVIDLLENN